MERQGQNSDRIKNLSRDIQKLIDRAQDPDPATSEQRKPFSVPNATCHTLRHTYGQLLYDTGKHPIDVVSELMGHHRVSTTTKYYVGKTKERKAMLAAVVRSRAAEWSTDNVIPIKQRA